MVKIGRNDPCPCGKTNLEGNPLKYKKCHGSAFYQEERMPVKRFFSSGPYTLCPKCGKGAFGMPMMGIGHDSYQKECYECGYTESYKLPKLKKKIIYLDQFVIDNFVKVLDPKHPKHEKVKADPFWLEAFEKLEVLSKAQLIVCPDSFYHRDESGPTGYFKHMQRIYEHFSGGATFYGHDMVVKSQMIKHFKAFLLNPKANFPAIDPAEIVMGRLYDWHERMKISINMQPKDEEVQEKLASKQKSYEQFVNVFNRWQTEQSKKFDDWYQEETRGYIMGTIQAIKQFYIRRQQLPQKYLETGDIDLNDVFPPSSLELIEGLRDTALREGCTTEEAYNKIGEYLQWQNIEAVPAIRIGSLLFAAIADQAAKGRKVPPTPGVMVDVNMISAFLPYCDAMFVDNENAALLEDGRVKARIGYPAKIYSRRNKEQFLAHLDEILGVADPDHIKLVRDVYGDDWMKPYIKILEHENEDKDE